MQNITIERTRGPNRRTPWWLYAGGILFAALVVWGIVKVLPSNDGTDSDEEIADVMIPVAEADAPAAPAETTEAPSAPAQPAAPGGLDAAGAAPLLSQAEAARAAGDFNKARELALEVWEASGNGGLKRQAEAILNEVSVELALTPRSMPEKVDYTVASGDSLDKIAKKFDTTIDLVRKSNNISGSLIRIGDRLRVLQGTFKLEISKSDNDLVLYLNDKFFKRYRVGTGQYNKTPVGDFFINDRIAQPTWWRPDGKAIPYGDPENLLGTHWLSINAKGYGIHGTWEPDTIGHQLSAGCVRLLNQDIEELYTLLPVGTPVTIRD